MLKLQAYQSSDSDSKYDEGDEGMQANSIDSSNYNVNGDGDRLLQDFGEDDTQSNG